MENESKVQSIPDDSVLESVGGIGENTNNVQLEELSQQMSNLTTDNEADKNFYAVANGRVCGIFTTWAEAEPQVTGYTGNNHKKLKTKEEAVKYILDYESTQIGYSYKIIGNEDQTFQSWNEMERKFLANPDIKYIRVKNEELNEPFENGDDDVDTKPIITKEEEA